MRTPVLGFHHATAMAGEAQSNLEFYTRLLGLRLVKRSVNQDAPNIYHLFYADAIGTPGTDITFFPWRHLVPFQLGTGVIIEQGLAVPTESLDYWHQRLEQHGVRPEPIQESFGQPILRFQDPDGLPLALVGTEEVNYATPYSASAVPEVYQIRGLYTARLCVAHLGATERVLTEILGMEKVGEAESVHRYRVGSPGDKGFGYLEVAVRPDLSPGRWGRGGMHHLAWRVHDETHLDALRTQLARVGLSPTPIIDRFWFRSVYFREPGGVIFELATDGPGFGIDEPIEHLGEQLVLPPWLESQRAEIEASLPSLQL
ncbi:MAG: ring-cleaving dioxygenase [Fimbriimonadales bacterium]